MSELEKLNLDEFEIDKFIIGQNLYIEASAGTGKTYTIELLVEKLNNSITYKSANNACNDSAHNVRWPVHKQVQTAESNSGSNNKGRNSDFFIA